MASSPEPISVLFVCLGNICRSTMAEGVFRNIVSSNSEYKSLIKEIDSCGTGAYHVGATPDSRTMSTLKANGITDYRHSARKVRKDDFEKFDYVFAMDEENLEDLKSLQRRTGTSGKAKVMLFGEYGGGKRAEIVDDPYYGGGEGFKVAYEQVTRFSRNFLKEVFPGVEG